MARLHDMHCHLNFVDNAEDVAKDADAHRELLFANTVSPEDWVEARNRLAACRNVRVGFGMHPWWVAADETPPKTKTAARVQESSESMGSANRKTHDTSAEAQRARVLELLESHDPAFIGEVGLDFGQRNAHSRSSQINMFNAIAQWCAGRTGKLVSIHSIKAAREVLETLEKSGAIESSNCIFHWFTGPSDLLKRAIEDGCYFSCGARMLSTGKGREYAKAIPTARLLLETDAPPQQGMRYSYEELHGELLIAARTIAEIKGEEALETIARTSEKLLAST